MKYENKQRADEIYKELSDLKELAHELNTSMPRIDVTDYHGRGVTSFNKTNKLFGEHVEPFISTLKTTVQDEIDKLEKELESL